MKRKLLSVILILLLLLSLAIPAYATDPEVLWVVDNGNLLTSEEVAELNKKIQDLRSELELEIVIVTTYGTDGKDVQQYADDFYDVNGYGYGDTNSGILLLLDMESRQWYMSTCGEAIYIFTDYGLYLLGEEILPWLSSSNYYEAFLTWLNALPGYVEAYRGSEIIDGFVEPDEYDSPYGDETIYYYEDNIGIRIQPFPIALVVGFIAALITILIMRSRMNTAKLQRGAVNYLKEGSFQLRQRSDMYLYSRMSRTPRPKNTSHSGGGSSVHRSSGGVRHGGRGGRF